MTVKTVEKTKNSIPKLRHHKASGRAYVVLNTRAFWLGKSGTEEAEQNYNKTIAEWLSMDASITRHIINV